MRAEWTWFVGCPDFARHRTPFLAPQAAQAWSVTAARPSAWVVSLRRSALGRGVRWGLGARVFPMAAAFGSLEAPLIGTTLPSSVDLTVVAFALAFRVAVMAWRAAACRSRREALPGNFLGARSDGTRDRALYGPVSPARRRWPMR